LLPFLLTVQLSRFFDLDLHIKALDRPPTSILKEPKPVASFKSQSEGYGLAWSPVLPGRLISSDCSKNIFLWDYTEGKWIINENPFTDHQASVEDLQWSPSEQDVFASCSCDRTIKLWDARKGKSAVATIEVHSSDVNVISWNTKRAFLLASGGDDGKLNILDLRKLRDQNFKPMFSFDFHKKPITSLEWNPNDDSGLAVTSEDDSASMWDLSLSPEKTNLKGVDIPSQLMFVHQGQNEIKDIHWHKQIPGCLVTTAAEGLNIFKPFNL